MESCLSRARRILPRLFSFTALTLAAAALSATSVVPISDRELHARADAVVRGIVVSSEVFEDSSGRPETVTVIEPLEVVKGRLAGALVLHQLGGELPDGRFFKMWGRPEYRPGREVVVFAIARPEGDFQTAELLLGQFEVQRDEDGAMYAVPALAAKAGSEVTIVTPRRGKHERESDGSGDSLSSPRDLSRFLEFLRRPGETEGLRSSPAPSGRLQAVVHAEYARTGLRPEWENIGGLWRYNNGASAVWTLDGEANITGGGAAETTAATQTWNAEPNSTINYTIGTGGANPIHLNALSSPCGWSTCMSTGGVIGCGGPDGVGGTNTWLGESYATIAGGEVWLRSYCKLNLWDSVTTQSVLTHELGHTLGLGHSDDGASKHDVCRGDEDLATMRSFVQQRVTLGTDDSDAVRWLYGDGGNSCHGGGPTLTVTKGGAGSGTVTSAPAGISCGTTCSFDFGEGSVVILAAAPASNSAFAGWSGDADCSDGSVTMSAARNCTANFNLLPDLIVSALAAPASANAGSQISVSESTKNQGGASAASMTRYYLSANSTWEATDTPIGARSIATLAAGATSTTTVLLTIPAATLTGNYYVLARADADGQNAESNEANNVRADSIHVGPPDLSVSAVSAPTLGGAGLSITVTDTTRNLTGVGPAPASATRFFLSRDAVLDASDVQLGSRNVPSLQPGDSSAGSTPLPIPAGTAPGAYFVIAKADGADSIAETAETNNTRSDTITIGPNLSVSALTAPSTAGAGMPVTVTDTTKNSGGGAVAGSTTSFYLSANSTFGTGDVLLGGRSTGPISPSSSTPSVSTTLTIPAGTAPGSYYILARADDGGAVAETDETDNTRSVLVHISPDLIVSVLTVPASAAAGSTISVSDTTKNQGQGIAAATATRLYLSTNNLYDASDTPLGTRDAPVLAYGASSSGSTSLVIPPGTAAGTYYILARADDGAAVAESNEGNNVAARVITIPAP